MKLADLDIKSAILYGIGFWVIATLLQDTAIFNAIANLPEIGLFLGVIIGAFKK